MSPRRASLRVAHQRTCPNASRTSLDSLTGCTCRPSYYVFSRARDGSSVKSERVTDRREAQKALTAKQAELDSGRSAVKRRPQVTFDEWAATWQDSLELANRRASTIRAYMFSIEFGREVFGSLFLHEIGNDELRQLVRKLKARKMRDVTIAKHLRHLSACFEAALAEPENTGLEHNPVGRFRRSFVLDVKPSEANYFTDGELAKLWAQLRTGLPRKNGTFAPVAPVYLHLCRFAVASGARIGELLALRWGDVQLAAGPHGEVRISKSWGVDGETAPKTRKSTRTLHLTADARRVLGDVAQLAGMQDDSALVFENGQGSHLSGSNISNRVLNPALVAAGVPKVGDDSPEPRSFHTLRHNYARAMLEAGQPLQWVADELGHESTATTELVYGHWAKQARRDAAGAVPEGALPV
jgi:integrase